MFNRVFYSLPATGNGTGTATAATYNNPFPVVGSSSGALSAGYGYVNAFNGYGHQSAHRTDRRPVHVLRETLR